MTFLPLIGGTLSGPGDLTVEGVLSNVVSPPDTIAPGNAIFDQLTTTANTSVSHNAYVDTASAWRYVGTGPATAFNMGNGVFSFFTAPSGTADATVSWTSLGTLDANGNLTVTNSVYSAGAVLTGPLWSECLPPSGGQIRLMPSSATTSYGVILRNDGGNFYILLTNNNDAQGSYNGLRPLIISDATGLVTFGNGATVYGGMTVYNGIISASSITLGNAQWLYGNDTGGTGRGLLTLWSDNNIYLGAADRPLFLRGPPINMADTTGTFAVFQRGDVQSTVYSNFSPRRWRLQVNGGDEPSCGSIDYRGFLGDALCIVGAGTTGSNRLVRIWDNVIVMSNLTVNSTFTASGGQVSSLGGNAGLLFQDRNSSYQWQWYSISNVARLWWNGSGDIMTVDTGGNIHSNGEIRGEHSLATAGYLWVNGAQLYVSSDGWFYTPNSFRAWDIQSSNNVNATSNVFIGGTQIYNNGGYVYTPNGLGANGDVYSNSSVRAGAYLTCGGVSWSNNGGWMYSGSSVQTNGNLQANGGVVYLAGMYWQNNGGWMYCPWQVRTDGTLQAGGDVNAGGVVRFNGMYWQNNGGWAYCPWSVNTGGNLNVNGYGQFNGNAIYGGSINVNSCHMNDWGVQYGWASGSWLALVASDLLYTYNQQGFAGGVYWTYCDERMKWNFAPVTRDCLAAINAIALKAYDFSEGFPPQRRANPEETRPDHFQWEDLPRKVKHIETGFIAQQLREIIPEAVPDPPEEGAFLSVDMRPLVATLIGALQQVTKRLEALEGR